MSIVGGHFIHDVYSSFFAPLLPEFIEKLSLSLTKAGTLSAIMQLPAILNPFIGYIADKVSFRYFVILAPAITATLMSFMGFAPNYLILAIILFITGISTATFHAPAPAMIGRLSGDNVGKGMGLFLAGGELGRTLGPLLAVWAVSTWTLAGLYRVVVIGWTATLILYLRLRRVSARPSQMDDIRTLIPYWRRLYLPLTVTIFFRMFLAASLGTYLPTYMKNQGSSLVFAGGALAILEFAGVLGALISGTLSDRFGRKPILYVLTIASSILTFVFINTEGWLLVPVLLVLGFCSLSSGPIYLAIVQEQLPNNRAIGNGLYMAITFLIRSFAMFVVGYFGDLFGLQWAYTSSALIMLLTIPGIMKIPDIE